MQRGLLPTNIPELGCGNRQELCLVFWVWSCKEDLSRNVWSTEKVTLKGSRSWKIVPKISNQSCTIKLYCHVPVMAHVLLCTELKMISNSDSRPPWIWSQRQQSYLDWSKDDYSCWGLWHLPSRFQKEMQLLTLACATHSFPQPQLEDQARWIWLLKHDAPEQREAPPALDALCPSLWMSLGWVSFAREQTEEDGRFWFLWILG